MIFDLYKAHQIMQSDKYGYFGKLLQLRKTGLTYKEIYKFVDLYLELPPDTPFKAFKPDNEKYSVTRCNTFPKWDPLGKVKYRL